MPYATQDNVASPRPWLAAGMLCWREIVRFLRQRNRVVGAIGQPVLFWLLFGAGLHRTFRISDAPSEGQSFLQFYFPGTMALILLFTAIFATISIIEDRREGFLQSVLVAPIPRWSMVLGKILGGTLIALFQGLIFLLLALTIQVDLDFVSFVQLVALLFVAGLALTSLGFVIAWRMESTQGFHAVMSLLLMPMWLLSGSFFPVPLAAGGDIVQAIMHWGMRLNPMTYCVGGIRRLLYGQSGDMAFYTPSLSVCWVVTILFAALMFAAAWRTSAKRTTGDLL